MVTIEKGNLIDLAFAGRFDVVAHGCNCMCVMASGIAPHMAYAFGADKYKMEHESFVGDVNKLGTIDFEARFITEDGDAIEPLKRARQDADKSKDKCLHVVNCYTQYGPGVPNQKFGIPLDYDALIMCMKKMNQVFKGSKIGLPWIGCGLAGGSKTVVKSIIEQELTDCEVTIVEL